MTSPAADHAPDQVARLFAQGQQALTDAVDAVSRSWLEAVRQFAPGSASFAPAVVPAEVVDRFFDTGVAVLEAQRALVHGTVGALRATGPAAPAAGADRSRL